jgi:hypothetical protein
MGLRLSRIDATSAPDLLLNMSAAIQHPWALAVAGLACVPVYGAWGRLLFGSWRSGIAALGWVFTRDKASFFRGDYVDDKFAEIRLMAWLVLCGITMAAAYKGLSLVIEMLGI